MIRILLFLIFIFFIGLGFTWLADRPGEMVMTLNGFQYRISLMVAAVSVVAIVSFAMLTWWVLKGVWNSPYTVSRYFRVRRRDRGYQALSTGLIAAASGDSAKARSTRKQAAKLINSDQEPLLHLLDAQTAMLEGDHDSARASFEAMLDDPEMRLLGLRGLYLEAERQGDRIAARHYAGRAMSIAPQLAWASDATFEDRIEQGDWDGALKLVQMQKSTHQISRAALARRKAVMFTAKAQAEFETDFEQARMAALEANKLQPEFVPAAVLAARAHFRNEELKRGSKILETAWKAHPHPELAQAYVFARPGNSTHDRLARARKLQALRPNNVESSLVVARAALAAGEFALARKEAEAALRIEPREGIYLLLADIEEADGRNQGKIRQYLAQALRAPRDPVWVADGFVSDQWAPVSPLSGRLDAFEWRSPVERVMPIIEQHVDAPHEDEPELPLIELAKPSPKPVADTPKEKPGFMPAPSVQTVAAKSKPVSVAEDMPQASGFMGLSASIPENVPDAIEEEDGDKEDAEKEVLMSRLPDDPGVRPEAKKPIAASKFRLF